MPDTKQIKEGLDKKLKKVRETPENFALYVSLHDFVHYIESIPSFAPFFDDSRKGRAKELPIKYSFLKQVYQGIEDIDVKTTDDLGHDRFVAIRELTLIRANNLSENNSFWKKRELFRKLVNEVHTTLHAYLAGAEAKKQKLTDEQNARNVRHRGRFVSSLRNSESARNIRDLSCP